MNRAVVWFRNDLRVNDNEALSKAQFENDEIIPVFILDEKLLSGQTYGFNRMGPFRLRFLIESVISLKEQLTEISGGLIISVGNPVEILNQICH